MSRRLNLSKTLGCTLFLTLLATPVFAHTVKVAEDVAGTWHVEPNHNPKAGEPARAWVALTRKGGKLLSLDQANCRLAVYNQPKKSGDTPVLQPALKAISAEKYQGIPGADLVFPKAGIYQLELGCTPKIAGSFKPFQMQYEVTVAAGAAPTPKAETRSTPQEKTEKTLNSESQSGGSNSGGMVWAIAVGLLLGLGFLGIVGKRFFKR
jgi:hypothetical protein